MKYLTLDKAIEALRSIVCFLTEHNENLWWYDGQRITFRSPNYSRILQLMLTEPTLSVAEIQRRIQINASAVQKLLNNLLREHYIEKAVRRGCGGYSSPILKIAVGTGSPEMAVN